MTVAAVVAVEVVVQEKGTELEKKEGRWWY
jgi:hypothetical protein